MITNRLSGDANIRSRRANFLARCQPSRLGWVVMLTLGSWAATAQAHEFRYRYVSLDQVEVPSGFVGFFPASINDSGRVYGTVCDDGELCNEPHIAFYKNGAVTVLPSRGEAVVVNAAGTVGGFVVVDPENFVAQAAIFRRGEVELIPPQPGEIFALVVALNDRGQALIESDDASGQQTFLLRSNGQTTRLDFGPTVRDPVFFNLRVLNDRGIIAGTEGPRFIGDRGFRFDVHTGVATILEPLSTEPLSWGLSVNNRGDVLGYSFNILPINSGGVERIGVWDRTGEFKTYFVEGNPEFPTISDRLLFNDTGLIVITLTHSNNSYLVPEPGVRLDLADLVEHMPQGQDLRFITDMNNHGSMIGSTSTGSSFLLERIGRGDH